MTRSTALPLALGLATAAVALAAAPDPAGWDTFSDTWVATDALGRRLPTHDEVGSPRPDRTAGLFYFLWLGSHGRELHDNTRILAAQTESPAWGPAGSFHFWGEPLFGYYLSEDPFVLRKHAQMLTDAGVDVLVFDVTNGFTYDAVFLELCRIYAAIRQTGQTTPRIAFIAHSDEGRVVRDLFERFYRPGLHADLWFRWLGKPLVLASPKNLAPELREFFTVRESWAWSDPQGWFGDGQDKWPWIDHHPQRPGWHLEPRRPEQISVCVAQHPTSNIGRSFHDGRQPAPADIQPSAGLCFAEQWSRALAVNPPFVFVTGWNEWVAQRFISAEGEQPFLGKPVGKGGTFFVDQFNQEFSRDIEPMRGGHGDNYFYQLADALRRYKGARPIPLVRSQPIRLDGEFKDWEAVEPEFRDTLGDPVERDHAGWDGAGRYVNHTGRNDLAAAKISADADRLCFYVRAQAQLSPSTDPSWMLLFIDVDARADTGWLGYDFVVNRSGLQGNRATVERNVGRTYTWEPAGTAAIRVGRQELELAIPRSVLELAQLPASLDFKWADHLGQTGDWSDFTLNGDAAPNDRFNYRARFRPR